MIPVIAVACTLAALVLFVARLLPRLKLNTRVLVPALCIALLALMLTPAIWSAVPAVQTESIVLATNKGVMALGGFRGSDPILTTNQLAALVANGTVRFFLLNGSGGFGGGPGGGQSSLTTWVTQHCTTVPASQWQAASSTTSSSNSMQLYNCAAAK